ncbi:nitroreductase [Sphingobacterium sp. KB22]|uniref:Nitroreductase n=1 Tax=Sphingobacterium hungaricum TaxID=2082723 RepID=A0A928UWF3_9SPHI|nr:nitroreductase [Sphingobacterium hungaricum]
MKNLIRKILRPVLEIDGVKSYLLQRLLFRNYKEDAKLYREFAVAFNNNGIKNKEANLILNYHSLEKGLLFKDTKKGFGEYRIKNLHKILKDPEIVNNIDRSQIRVGYQVMCQYYEVHQKLNYNIDNVYTIEQYNFYKSVLDASYSTAFTGVIEFDKETFYKDVKSDFEKFAFSRKSVRNFTGEKIDVDRLRRAMVLANSAPSVCNRQASNVYLIEDKKKIDKILEIQAGFSGYTEHVSQLLILTNDRNYYYTVGERNQLFIDGGLFLMNLLYALHYYQIGNCPANWGKTIKEESPIQDVISLPKSEKIICILPIGVVDPEFKTTLSLRRTIDENFIVLD